MHRSYSRTALPQHTQFVTGQSTARVQRELTAPVNYFCELPGCPCNLAVRNAKPDQVSLKMRPRRRHPGLYLFGESTSVPARCNAVSGHDLADAISRPPQLQCQCASESSGSHNRDARLAYHRRSIALPLSDSPSSASRTAAETAALRNSLRATRSRCTTAAL